MIDRILTPSKSTSYFLFGPRGTGKTTLLHSLYPPEVAWYVDLLDPDVEDRYSKRPALLERDLLERPSTQSVVVIDEIQKVPRILDIVHKLMGSQRWQFICTGSSARKLRRGGADLLAGRAFVYHLHPLTVDELGEEFDLGSALQWGTLPAIRGCAGDQDRADHLRAYAHTYVMCRDQIDRTSGGP